MPTSPPLLVGGAAGGYIGYKVSNDTLGQPNTYRGGSIAALQGALLGGSILVGAHWLSEWIEDPRVFSWAITPVLGATGLGTGIDAYISNVANPSYGAGLRRKC